MVLIQERSDRSLIQCDDGGIKKCPFQVGAIKPITSDTGDQGGGEELNVVLQALAWAKIYEDAFKLKQLEQEER